jgi:DNA invertase Pin-like site-specific DNA recombinase
MVKAAEYVRMSTEHQKYSIENQRAAISEYAGQHGLKITKTYSDAAKSGLLLKRRTGLRQLLRDVVGGNFNYNAVLVYDVSRWGRFQDDDEAACYEFLCRNSGVGVIYCAETFANDGSVASSILKNLCRASAREFSRDLSTRVFEAKARVAQRGFWVGGPAPYAYRRMIVSNNPRARNRILAHGERKYLTGDRVILVPGLRRETDLVRAMFNMVVKKKMGAGQIANRLNRHGITNRGAPWITLSVRNILTSPMYTGCNVWNRTSKKLGGPSVRITPEKWICKSGAFVPIITENCFDRAQYVLKKRREDISWTDEEILSKLRTVLAKMGDLSEEHCRIARGMPSPHTISHHFGSVIRAYELVGYRAAEVLKIRTIGLRRTFALRERVFREISTLFPGQITISHTNSRPRLHFRVGIVISLLVVPSVSTKSRGIRWPIIPVAYERQNPVLLCRLNATNDGFHSFYLFPQIFLRTYHRIREGDPWLAKGKKLSDLSELCKAASNLVADIGVRTT